MERRADARTLIAFIVMVVLLGSNFVAVRFSNRELMPLWGAGARFLLAGILLGAFAAWRRVPLPRGRTLLAAVAYGALLFGANYGFAYVGLVHASAGLASVLFATIPLATMLLAAGSGLEAWRGRALVGALVALAGVGVVFREQLVAQTPAAAIASLSIAAIAAAAASVVVKRAPRTHPVGTNVVGMLVGSVLLLAVSWTAGELWYAPREPQTVAAFAWLVASGIVSFVLMVWILQRWTATAASYAAVLTPLVTIVVAAVLAGEPVTPGFLGGAAVVLAGVWVGAIRRARADARRGRRSFQNP